MNDEVVIQVENLGKKYRIQHQAEGRRYVALRDVIAEKLKAPWRRFAARRSKIADGSSDQSPNSQLPSSRTSTREDFWALRDVSFEVRQGEVVGIIGRNGAGKSTLLKILSRITEPSEGRVRIKGRVASLLEVGTGFHPELTGRENVFLNGAILGMTRVEIKKKFDEIVAFAEVEKFLDTPVKRYSSGMYVRLAFAVAAHLEPEILVVDEVLAVGDAQFQKKCLGKMGEVAKGGRTVLFVSHNMAAVKAICSRALLLAEGELRLAGTVGAVVAAYLQGGRDEASEHEWKDPGTAPGNEHIRLEFVRVRPPAGEPVITIDTGAVMEVGFHNERPGINLAFSAYLNNSDGLLVLETGRILTNSRDSRTGTYRATGVLPGHLLNSGRYSITFVFGKDQAHVLFRAEDIVSFTVEHTATGRGFNMSVAPGVVRPLLEWQHVFSEAALY